MVARFNSGSSLYIQNADEKHVTNAAGLAHFELNRVATSGKIRKNLLTIKIYLKYEKDFIFSCISCKLAAVCQL